MTCAQLKSEVLTAVCNDNAGCLSSALVRIVEPVRVALDPRHGHDKAVCFSSHRIQLVLHVLYIRNLKAPGAAVAAVPRKVPVVPRMPPSPRMSLSPQSGSVTATESCGMVTTGSSSG